MKNILYTRLFSSLIIIPISLIFIIKNSFYFNSFLLFCFLVSMKEWFDLCYKKIFFYIGNIFLVFAFLNAYWLRNIDDGLFLFLFVIIVCISSDIGGYTFGNLFNGPKLTKISPNKTYAGVIGGYFLSFFSVYIYWIYSTAIFGKNMIFDEKVLIVVFFISSISQIGDLIVSYFKRKAKIKDTGSLIPGHGGILDRVDGMIFAIPFANLIFYFFKF